jgi:uncharacterized Zn finger protein
MAKKRTKNDPFQVSLDESGSGYEYDAEGPGDDEPEGEWRPYVSKRKRQALAQGQIHQLKEKGLTPLPVRVGQGPIAGRPWGQAWCKNIECFSDFKSRLPAGRTCLRQNAVIHLEVAAGLVTALVQGDELYRVSVAIQPVNPDAWENLRRQCHGHIGSLLELIQGNLKEDVMALMARSGDGLFPAPYEIEFRCSCPDWAQMCQHVAATLYGVGHRLDQAPELLFTLRGVDASSLVDGAVDTLVEDLKPLPEAAWDDSELGDLFGIDLAP